MGIVYIVIFSFVGLLLLIIIDKRKAIASFFKTKIFKPKEIKIPKAKNPIDTDTLVDVSQLKYEPLPEIKKSETVLNDDKIFDNKSRDIFDSLSIEDDDIDLDLMYENLKREQDAKLNRRYQSENLEQVDLPDFESMSMNELDDLLESNLSQSNLYDYVGSNDALTGIELGSAIKRLPKQIKILIVSDFFKRKY